MCFVCMRERLSATVAARQGQGAGAEGCADVEIDATTPDRRHRPLLDTPHHTLKFDLVTLVTAPATRESAERRARTELFVFRTRPNEGTRLAPRKK